MNPIIKQTKEKSKELREKMKRKEAVEKKVKELMVKAEENPHAQEIMDDIVHDLKSKEASELNNMGIEAQLTYAVMMGDTDYVEKALKG